MLSTFLLTLLILIGPLSSEGAVELAGEIRLELSEGWSLQTSDPEYPFQIANDVEGAELLIFRSVFSGDEMIRNEEEFKLSVDAVVNDVILGLPEAAIRSNTGYFDDNRVRFILEFVSLDTTSGVELWHRLVGYIYQHPAGHQVLFTLWGNCPSASPPSIREALKSMQAGFEYTGPATGRILSEDTSGQFWYLGAIIVIVICVLLIKRRHREFNSVKFSDESHFWRCCCGRLNHDHLSQCRRCGNRREKQTLT